MKKTALLLALVLILSLLSACGGDSGSTPAETVKDPGMDAVKSAVSACLENDEMMELDTSYIEALIKLSAEDYAECYAMRSSVGTNIDEYGIFRCSGAEQTAATADALKTYVQFLLDAWMQEYLPEEFPKLQNAEVWTEGDYVVYAIVSDDVRGSMKDAFCASFEP